MRRFVYIGFLATLLCLPFAAAAQGGIRIWIAAVSDYSDGDLSRGHQIQVLSGGRVIEQTANRVGPGPGYRLEESVTLTSEQLERLHAVIQDAEFVALPTFIGVPPNGASSNTLLETPRVPSRLLMITDQDSGQQHRVRSFGPFDSSRTNEEVRFNRIWQAVASAVAVHRAPN